MKSTNAKVWLCKEDFLDMAILNDNFSQALNARIDPDKTMEICLKVLKAKLQEELERGMQNIIPNRLETKT